MKKTIAPTPNNTSRLTKAMADRSRGHRGATIKRKKSYKIVGCRTKSARGGGGRTRVPAARSALRECFGSIVSNDIELLTKLVPGGSAKAKRSAGIAALAEMVGSVILSRVVPDPALSGEIIDTVSNDLVKRHAKSSRTA